MVKITVFHFIVLFTYYKTTVRYECILVVLKMTQAIQKAFVAQIKFASVCVVFQKLDGTHHRYFGEGNEKTNIIAN